MIIESIIRRAAGTKVKLGDDIYYFFTHMKGSASHVCEVTDEDHIQTFLSIKEGYRIFKQPKPAVEPTKAEANPAPAKPEALVDDKPSAEKADPEAKKPAKGK